MRLKNRYSTALILSTVLLATFLFNEFLIYYVTISFACRWPKLVKTSKPVYHIFIISDLHLLGIYRGHWFDKLRREWQIYRSFQSATHLLSPNAVFFLGDQFDEGLLGPDEVFEMYASRFDSLMKVPSRIQRYVLVGNHDIGFHNEISPWRLNRFVNKYNTTFVSHATIGNNHFVLINSMAMERDGCQLCRQAEKELDILQKKLQCISDLNCNKNSDILYTPPILLQHFPLFRRDDSHCGDDPDTAPLSARSEKFREKLDCLSADATDRLLKAVKPRAVFDGHIHFGCKTWWPKPYSVWEWTVPSFSWRNTPQPGFMLLSVAEDELLVSKCLLPNELTVIALYTIVGILCLVYAVYVTYRSCCLKKRRLHPTYQLLTGKFD
uniref:Metallophos domain-containing protein n=1 Tax=Syphacia muris TaxID=451379 RepID=A0A0N5ANU3_9BILA